MYMCTSVRPLTQAELCFRRRVLRDAVICVGWLKLLSFFCYMGLFILIHTHSRGRFSTALQAMTLSAIPMQIFNGVILFLGAVENKILALDIGVWLCILIAAYNTVTGLFGGIYFIRVGFLTIHFLISVFFAILAMSILTVLCHDVIVIYTFRTLLQEDMTSPRLENIPVDVYPSATRVHSVTTSNSIYQPTVQYPPTPLPLVKSFYSERYYTLKQDIKENTSKPWMSV